MLNIVIPMAGRGTRFVNAGFTQPKPLISIHNVPMIQVVVDNLRPNCEHQFIFVCQNQHIDEYGLTATLTGYAEKVHIVGIDHVTEGQACTVLCATKIMQEHDPVLVANSDQFVDIKIDDFLEDFENRSLDGSIMTMLSTDPKWSYAKTNEDKLVIQTAEKEVISENAAVGLFAFRHAKDLVNSVEAMIAANRRINNEFYICPAFNYLIAEGKRIGAYSVGKDRDGMYGLGQPDDLEFFLSHPISEKFKQREC